MDKSTLEKIIQEKAIARFKKEMKEFLKTFSTKNNFKN